VTVFTACFSVKYDATLSAEFLRTNRLIFVMEGLCVFRNNDMHFKDVILNNFSLQVLKTILFVRYSRIFCM
jgi:hypothetical protein